MDIFLSSRSVKCIVTEFYFKPSPASGEEGLADTEDDWQPSLQDSDTILGKNLPF